MATPIFDHAYSKTVKQLLATLDLHEHAESQFIPSIHSWDTVNFRVL